MISLPSIATAAFPADSAPDWYFEGDSTLGPLKIDFHTDAGMDIGACVTGAVPLLEDVTRIDAAARAAIRDDFATGEGASSFAFLDYHLDECGEDELAECFGADSEEEIGVEQLLGALRLRRIGFYWRDALDAGEQVVLDYGLDGLESDQIIVVYAGLDGVVASVQMES